MMPGPASGGGGLDTLKGANGNDSIEGDRGADRIVGGRGLDAIKGGEGRTRSSDAKEAIECAATKAPTRSAEGRETTGLRTVSDATGSPVAVASTGSA
jgi:hypothetical protein